MKSSQTSTRNLRGVQNIYKFPWRTVVELVFTYVKARQLNKAKTGNKNERSGRVEVWCWVEVLQVRAPPVPLPLSSWLQVGVPLTPAAHLHVQKSPVLKCCGVSSPPASVCGRPVCNLFKCLWKLLVRSHRRPLTPDMLFWPVKPAFSRLLGYFQELSQWLTGTQVTVVCHGFCPQCLSFYFHSLIPFGWSWI